MGLFTKDPAVVDVGAPYLRIAAFIEYAYVLLFVNTSALQGLKKPAFALWIGLYRQIVAPFAVFWLLTRVWDHGLFGIWWGIFGINWTAAAVAVWWAQRQVGRSEDEAAPAPPVGDPRLATIPDQRRVLWVPSQNGAPPRVLALADGDRLLFRQLEHLGTEPAAGVAAVAEGLVGRLAAGAPVVLARLELEDGGMGGGDPGLVHGFLRVGGSLSPQATAVSRGGNPAPNRCFPPRPRRCRLVRTEGRNHARRLHG